MAEEQQVGVVIKFFAKPSVAAVEVSDIIKKGDLLHFKGHTTDFQETVSSMEIDNQPVDEAKRGDLVGIKVSQRVREKDKVYKVVE